MEMLRREGPQERIFKEIQTIEANDFRWQEQVRTVTLLNCVHLDVVYIFMSGVEFQQMQNGGFYRT